VGGVAGDLRLRIKVTRGRRSTKLWKLVLSFRVGLFGGSNGGGSATGRFESSGEFLGSFAEKREGFDGVFGLRGLIIGW
jgi:hypothetical protein